MRMTKEFAEELDKILSGVSFAGAIYTLENSAFNPQSLGEILERNNHGIWIGQNNFKVYPEGFDFVKMGGYSSLFSKTEMKEKKERQEMEQTKRQIQALKREPYLIIWAIISTLATIALSVMHLIKS